MRLVIIFYVLMTCGAIAFCRIRDGVSPFTCNPLNCLSFLFFCLITLLALVVFKSVMVLRKTDQHCDENGILRDCHSWYLFLHFAFHNALRRIIPFTVSKIDFQFIDRNICVESGKKPSSQNWSKIEVPDGEKSVFASASNTLLNFASMFCTGVVSLITVVASVCFMSEKTALFATFIGGINIGLIGYGLLRIGLCLLNASHDVLIGKYKHARIIMYCFLLLFPLGTMMAVKTLKAMRADERGRA